MRARARACVCVCVCVCVCLCEDLTRPVPPKKQQHISHLEIEDPELCADTARWDSLLETLLLLPGLRALSLPNSLHVDLHPSALHELTHALRALPALRKLNLASCNLKDSLDQLLQGLDLGVVYLSLRDCRLTKVDVQALLEVSVCVSSGGVGVLEVSGGGGGGWEGGRGGWRGEGLELGVVYLSLRDCRLTKVDVQALLEVRECVSSGVGVG